MGSKRQEGLEAALTSLEAEYRQKLIAALRRCAAGYWGLFGQNAGLDLPDHLQQEAYVQSGASELDELGTEIAGARARLSMAEAFSLHERLQASRGRKTGNDLGEARLAQAWLEELDQP